MFELLLGICFWTATEFRCFDEVSGNTATQEQCDEAREVLMGMLESRMRQAQLAGFVYGECREREYAL